MITGNRIKALGLSPLDFERFLLFEGYTTQFEIAADPSIISELMSEDEIWAAYESDRERRYLGQVVE